MGSCGTRGSTRRKRCALGVRWDAEVTSDRAAFAIASGIENQRARDRAGLVASVANGRRSRRPRMLPSPEPRNWIGNRRVRLRPHRNVRSVLNGNQNPRGQHRVDPNDRSGRPRRRRPIARTVASVSIGSPRPLARPIGRPAVLRQSESGSPRRGQEVQRNRSAPRQQVAPRRRAPRSASEIQGCEKGQVDKLQENHQDALGVEDEEEA